MSLCHYYLPATGTSKKGPIGIFGGVFIFLFCTFCDSSPDLLLVLINESVAKMSIEARLGPALKRCHLRTTADIT